MTLSVGMSSLVIWTLTSESAAKSEPESSIQRFSLSVAGDVGGLVWRERRVAETAEGGNMETTSRTMAQEGATKRDCLVTRLLGVAESTTVHLCTVLTLSCTTATWRRNLA